MRTHTSHTCFFFSSFSLSSFFFVSFGLVSTYLLYSFVDVCFLLIRLLRLLKCVVRFSFSSGAAGGFFLPGAAGGFFLPGGAAGGFFLPGGAAGGFFLPGGAAGGFFLPGGAAGAFSSFTPFTFVCCGAGGKSLTGCNGNGKLASAK